jgi:hypothetical protein
MTEKMNKFDRINRPALARHQLFIDEKTFFIQLTEQHYIYNIRSGPGIIRILFFSRLPDEAVKYNSIYLFPRRGIKTFCLSSGKAKNIMLIM